MAYFDKNRRKSDFKTTLMSASDDEYAYESGDLDDDIPQPRKPETCQFLTPEAAASVGTFLTAIAQNKSSGGHATVHIPPMAADLSTTRCPFPVGSVLVSCSLDRVYASGLSSIDDLCDILGSPT